MGIPVTFPSTAGARHLTAELLHFRISHFWGISFSPVFFSSADYYSVVISWRVSLFTFFCEIYLAVAAAGLLFAFVDRLLEMLPIICFALIAKTTTALSIHSPHGAVASESTICSQIGIELLKRGVRTHQTMISPGRYLTDLSPTPRAMPPTPTWAPNCVWA